MLEYLNYSLRSGNVGEFVANRVAQWRNRDVKIFFIGYNKCATTAVSLFVARQGIKAVHWQCDNKNIALEIEQRLGDRAELRRYLGRWTSYSDLTYASDDKIIEGNRHFRLYHELFPRAFFVLNDRDPQAWIASRLAHRGGEFARRSARLRGCSLEDLPQAWLKDREDFYRDVTSHFDGYDRFLHFRVDGDDVSKLTDFFRPHFRLKPEIWAREHVSAR